MEKERLVSLFEKLYDGYPWLGVNIKSTLQGVSAQQAATKHFPNCNSIWQIVEHIISWKTNVLQRIQGEVITTPDNNYIEEITNTSEEAWQATIARLEEAHHKWLGYLKNFDEADFEKIYPPNGMTYYEHIHGIIQHDAYHLGQIVLLAKGIK
ncbi:MAG: DinB family protein [Fulvivirga sp.]|uniref:DinB family protein n=1 Tax=Fulvivirga sp. TaxID=1931237 RepID=UPI0033035786